MVLGDILRRNATIYPKEESLVFEDQRFTWAQTRQRVNALSNGIMKLGIKKGDRIAILSDNSHRYLEIFLAAAQSGFVIVPLNTMFKTEELTHLLENADVTALFCGRNQVNQKNALMNELTGIKFFIGMEDHDCPYDYEHLIRSSPSGYTAVDVSPEDVFSIAYTSGTTGNPKGAVLTHRNCLTAAVIHCLEWRISHADNYLFPGRHVGDIPMIIFFA